MIFTSDAGEQYGYVDGWQEDGCFHYTGEGQEGDQELKQGNKALLLHKEDGKSIRLFEGARGDVTYAGEFELDGEPKYYTTDAPDVNGEIRKVIIFRLRPVGNVVKHPSGNVGEQLNLSNDVIVDEVETENASTETFVYPAIEQKTSKRNEAE